MEPLHKLSATVIFAFLSLHLANHFVGLLGVDAHMQVMGALRLIYRHPVVEGVLALSLVIQFITGFALVKEIWIKKKDIIHQLQAASGLLMALFILIHVVQMMWGRLIRNIDTNLYFVAADFTAPPLSYVMTGIYGVGLMALFTHFACIGYGFFKKENKPLGYTVMAGVFIVGSVSTWFLLAMLRGDLYPLDIPEGYGIHPVSATVAE